MPEGLKRGLEKSFVVSGDYIDSVEEDGIRVGGKVPLVYVGAASTTTIRAVDSGVDYIGDGVLGTGSTAVASFSASFTATPNVIGVPTFGTLGYSDVFGSGSNVSISLAGKTTGSAVFYGISGAGIEWIAIGDKY